MRKLLYVPVSAEALEHLHRQASAERRRPQDEAAILIERGLGIRPGLPVDTARSGTPAPAAEGRE